VRHFVRRERRGRLVQRHEPSLAHQCACQLHELALRYREPSHGQGRIDGQPQLRERACGPRAHRRLVETAAARGLDAEEDVGGCGEDGHERLLLIDHRDAAGERVTRRREANRLPVPQQGTAVRWFGARDELEQRRLAGAVLADHCVDRAGCDREIDAVERRHTGIVLGDAAQLEQGHERPMYGR
jgi:hypothetical protein